MNESHIPRPHPQQFEPGEPGFGLRNLHFKRAAQGSETGGLQTALGETLPEWGERRKGFAKGVSAEGPEPSLGRWRRCVLVAQVWADSCSSLLLLQRTPPFCWVQPIWNKDYISQTSFQLGVAMLAM